MLYCAFEWRKLKTLVGRKQPWRMSWYVVVELEGHEDELTAYKADASTA